LLIIYLLIFNSDISVNTLLRVAEYWCFLLHAHSRSNHMKLSLC